VTNATECAKEEAEPEPELEDENERNDAHLDDVEVGAGCTEIWEHLAEKREE